MLRSILVAFILVFGTPLFACVDAVVLVHGNAGSTSQWNNLYNLLRSQGYSANEIFRPNWGSKTCPACNNHQGSEETPVRNAMVAALNQSCTGKIDVLGHSMGATLAAQQILKLDVANRVDSFVGIAGAFRGLWTCGVYPYNVWSSTCGRYGLSINSPLVNSVNGPNLASRTYSIKSWVDQIVCATGTCRVNGKHSSQIDSENASYSYNYTHNALLTFTYQEQYALIR